MIRILHIILALGTALGTAQLAGSAQAQADPFAVDDSAIIERLGTDLQTMGASSAVEELNAMARRALELERPDLFRQVMIAHVDDYWRDMSDARTALNMIAWLPDTADYLSPRITAARLAISAQELSEMEALRLWRDLRARVERVGDPDLMIDLAGAMIEAQSTALLEDSIARFASTDRQRLKLLATLLEIHGRTAAPETVALLSQAIEGLAEENIQGDLLHRIVRAYWVAGDRQTALARLDTEADPLRRARSHFELLALTERPDAVGATAPVQEGSLDPLVDHLTRIVAEL